jgi:microcystin-dependent protein
VIGNNFANRPGYGPPSASAFRIPDLQGKFPVGTLAADSDFGTLGQAGGSKTTDIQHVHTTPAHAHPLSGTNAVAQIYIAAQSVVIGMNRVGTSAYNTTHGITNTGANSYVASQSSGAAVVGSTDNNTAMTTSGMSVNNTPKTIPPYLTINYIIKY